MAIEAVLNNNGYVIEFEWLEEANSQYTTHNTYLLPLNSISRSEVAKLIYNENCCYHNKAKNRMKNRNKFPIYYVTDHAFSFYYDL